jgi:GDP-6-deoxy-D-talose 4-dehydrogenase
MSAAPERVLITGLTGFTGTYLRAILTQEGYDVHGTVRRGESIDDRHHEADLCDMKALREVIDRVAPRHVAHLAAVSFVAHDDAASLYGANVVGTRNLLAALAGSSVAGSLRTVLLASSANVYGNTSTDPIPESEPHHPANDYAVSKVAMEHVAALWEDRLPITIVRPFNYTGVGQSDKFLIPKIVAAFSRCADVLELGNLDVRRDFSDVRDVTAAYARLLAESPRGTFNICSGRTHSLREVIQTVSELAGHRIEVRVNPQFVRANEVKTLRGSPALLKRLLPTWSPRPLQETLRWMLQERRSGPPSA